MPFGKAIEPLVFYKFSKHFMCLGNANWLTHAALDPFTLTAEYKACAVQLEKIA